MGGRSAEFERRRREDRGAEGAEGVGCGEEVSPPHWREGSGERAVPPNPLPRKNFEFGSQIGEFWCKLGAFCTVHLKMV